MPNALDPGTPSARTAANTEVPVDDGRIGGPPDDAPALDLKALGARYPHLKGSALEVVDASPADRAAFTYADRWIGYKAGNDALARMEDLLVRPRARRMRNMLLIGDTNNGKTAIISRFQAAHPAHDAPGMDGVIVPVVSVLAPPKPDEHRLWVEILRALNAPYRESDRTGKLHAQVVDLLQHVQARALVIDEIHNLLRGTMDAQRHLMAVLRDFVNKVQIPIIGAGIQDALNVVTSDPQLGNRFHEFVLPRWDVTAEFLMFLRRFESRLPLRRASGLADEDVATRIIALSEGTIGEAMALLSDATVKAIDTGDERISIGLLENLDWIIPSQRGRPAARAKRPAKAKG